MESVPMARSKLYSAEELLERRRARDRARKKDPLVKARKNEARRLRAQDPQVLRREADARRRSRHAKKDGAARHQRDSSYASDVIGSYNRLQIWGGLRSGVARSSGTRGP